jgi:cell division protein FtsQ
MHQLIDKKDRIFIYIILFFLLSTTNNKALQNKKKISNLINKINVTGLSRTNNLQIEKKMHNFFYQNIFFLNKEEIKVIMSEYNIIEEYTVKKIYPSKINIEIKPTKFVAKIYNDNRFIVGANGKIIEGTETKDALPYLSGEFNSKKFLELKKNIEDSRFNLSDFKIIFFYPSDRWDVLTTNGVLIKLNENNLLKSLNLGYKIINNNQLKDNKFIDLRIVNQVIIQ